MLRFNLERKKVEEKEKKCFIIDYSFYIYNGSFACKTPCRSSKKIDGKIKCDCAECEGTGWMFMNANGVRTGGLYHVLNAIIPKLKDGYEVITVFDPPKANLLRTKLLDDYKGNRAETPEWITYQMKLGVDLFPKTKAIQCYMADDEESDDVMACIAMAKAREGYEVILASDDKDMFPCLAHKNIKLFRQKELFTRADFAPYMKKKYGINFDNPDRFSEFLAIIGDSADNYNIIKGLGPKAAEFFLNKYDHINELWDDWDEIEDKYKKKLVGSCPGTTCNKCTHNPGKDKPCPARGTDLVYLKDELDLSLQLAYLNWEAVYHVVKQPTDIEIVKSELERLRLTVALNNLELLF